LAAGTALLLAAVSTAVVARAAPDAAALGLILARLNGP
jgi:hypothetical protein